jgi:hypothetical protein
LFAGACRIQHEADEAVALLAHAAHDRTAIIDLAGIAVDAECGQQRQLVARRRR